MNKIFLSTIIASIFSYSTLFSQSSGEFDKVEDYTKIGSSKIQECFYKAKQIRYKFDVISPGIPEYWQNPKETDSLKTGDCEDQVFYLRQLLKDENIFSEPVFGKYDSTDTAFHAWLELESRDTTYILDPALYGVILYRDGPGILGSISKDTYIIYLDKGNMDFLNYHIDRYNSRNKNAFDSLIFKNNRLVKKDK